MNSQPKISVLIPCYNSQEWVGEAIESCLAQEYENKEIIVIDDGSTDHSTQVLESFGDRIQWESIPNQGACAARNRAFSKSKGDLIQFLDADDVLLPGKFLEQTRALSREDVDIVFCHGKLFGDGKGLRPIKQRAAEFNDDDVFVYTLKNNWKTAAPLIPREYVENAGGFRVGLIRGQERDLFIRIAALSPKVLLEEKLLFAVRNHDSPQRLTNLKVDSEFNVNWYLNLVESLKEPQYKMNQSRWDALAGDVFQAGIYAYRNGFRDSARQAFDAAKALSHSFTYHERAWYKWLANRCGPMNAERFLQSARDIRSWVSFEVQ